MEEKVQLIHPEGKHAVRMPVEKYELLRKAILKCLAGKDPVTHTELSELVHNYLKKNKLSFNGSVDWHMESVKLDLEARKLVTRTKVKGKQMFGLTKQK
jgi:hypothetical protein